MKIVLQWKPDERTTVTVEGNNVKKVTKAAVDLVDFTTPYSVDSVKPSAKSK